MTLVEEATKSDEHVTMNRATHFIHLVRVTVPFRFKVTLFGLNVQLTQVKYGLSVTLGIYGLSVTQVIRVLSLISENFEESTKLRLSLLAEI